MNAEYLQTLAICIIAVMASLIAGSVMSRGR